MNLLALRESMTLLAHSASADPTPLSPPDPLVHFMNRTSFGIRESEYRSAGAIGYGAFVESQLAAAPQNAAAVESVISRTLPSVGMSGATLYNSYPPADNQDFVVLGELRAATFLRQVFSPNQLFEVMVEFWTDHFSIEHVHGFDRIAKTVDDQELRRNALGKFKDLLFANAKSPAMLFYLDNYTNVKSGPQENYARELLELHTLGVDGGYTEDDVKNVARAFTGWGIARNQIAFAFSQRNHDTDAKRFLGNTLPAGRGIEDGQDVLAILAAHPSTAKWIATKLVRRFVSDSPPANLISAVQAEYLRTDGDIRAMLRVIFNSVEFVASADLKVKRPQEFVQSVLRACEAKISGTTFMRRLTSVYEGLGHIWCNWPAPNGYPDVAAYWINTTAWLGRWNFVLSLLEGSLDRGITVDVNLLAGTSKSPQSILQVLSERVLRRKLSQADQQLLSSFSAAGNDPNAELPSAVRTTRANEVLALLLCSRYFNYR